MSFQHALRRQNRIESGVEILNIKIELTCTVPTMMCDRDSTKDLATGDRYISNQKS